MQITKYVQDVLKSLQKNEDDIVTDNQRDQDTQKETILSMVLAIDIVPPEVSSSLPPKVPLPNDTNPEEAIWTNEQMEDLSSQNTAKKLRLEQALTKIKLQLNYTMDLTESVINETQKGLEQ